MTGCDKILGVATVEVATPRIFVEDFTFRLLTASLTHCWAGSLA